MKRAGVIAGLVLILLGIGYTVAECQQYQSYSIEHTAEQGDAVASYYAEFGENLLRYTRDGAFYTDFDGNLIWNETYEMGEPAFESRSGYGILYDKNGTGLLILDTTGAINSMQTNMPITAACVANNGVIAVLMQEGSTGYIYIYNTSGTVLASGELHSNLSGYPVSIALSSDGTMLCVSLLDLKGGVVNSTINFYNFGTAGQDAIDNIVATYSYSDMVIPEVRFMKNDRAVAFGDTEYVIFTNGGKPEVDREIFLEEEVKCLFHNENYFGTITSVANEQGEVVNRMTIYNLNGRPRYTKDLDIAYKKVELMSNDEVFITDGSRVNLFNSRGLLRFDTTLDTYIYKAFPLSTRREYAIIVTGAIERIKLEK